MYSYYVTDPGRDGTPPWSYDGEDEADDEMRSMIAAVTARGLAAQTTFTTIQPNEGRSAKGGAYPTTTTANLLHAPAPIRQIDAQPDPNPADSGTSASNQKTKGKGEAGKTNPGVASSNTAIESPSGANGNI
jgi:hypothetical protein